MSRITMGIRLGVDIGGTFTDLVLIDEARGAVHIAKVLTRPMIRLRGRLRVLEPY